MKLKPFLIWLISTLALYKVHDFWANRAGGWISNQGISFGIGYGMVSVSVILCVVLLLLAVKENKLYLWLILAGGWANLIDRFRIDIVRDYWQIGRTGIYNNINDWIIALGVFLFLGEVLWKKKLK